MLQIGESYSGVWKSSRWAILAWVPRCSFVSIHVVSNFLGKLFLQRVSAAWCEWRKWMGGLVHCLYNHLYYYLWQRDRDSQKWITYQQSVESGHESLTLAPKHFENCISSQLELFLLSWMSQHWFYKSSFLSVVWIGKYYHLDLNLGVFCTDPQMAFVSETQKQIFAVTKQESWWPGGQTDEVCAQPLLPTSHVTHNWANLYHFKKIY